MSEPSLSYSAVELPAEEVEWIYKLAYRLVNEGENPKEPPKDSAAGLAWALGVLAGKAAAR